MLKIKLVDNEVLAEERAIDRFHSLAFGNKIINYEDFYNSMTHKDLARIACRIARQVQALNSLNVNES